MAKRGCVVIGMSGGVDSSVAAHLLIEQGYEVKALFMRNWHDTTGTLSGECTWSDDQTFAELVAKRLDIPFHYIDLSEQYRARVVDYMFSEYEKGRTPNPDVLCNREIKFDVFLKEALKLGADHVATGHYCRVESEIIDGKEVFKLLSGVDGNKDQSYFLCQLSQEQLSKSMFPIGDIIKPEVRRIAEEHKLATAQRKDSQGICFVGKVDLPIFLQQKLKAKKGKIVEIMSDWNGYKDSPSLDNLEEASIPYNYKFNEGKVVGEHNGAHFYTIGQRKGLNVGGKPEPLFVINTDVENNIIFVGMGDSHPGLYRKVIHILPKETHWIREDLALKVGESRRFDLRIRYRQPLQKATLTINENGTYLIFDQMQRGVTAGQFAAWYDGDELIGSGVINK